MAVPPVVATAMNQNLESVPCIRLGTTQNIATSASSQALTAFAATTTVIRVAWTEACYILIADTSTTVTTSNGTLCPGAGFEYFTVKPAQVLTVLRVATNGVLSVTQGVGA